MIVLDKIKEYSLFILLVIVSILCYILNRKSEKLNDLKVDIELQDKKIKINNLQKSVDKSKLKYRSEGEKLKQMEKDYKQKYGRHPGNINVPNTKIPPSCW